MRWRWQHLRRRRCWKPSGHARRASKPLPLTFWPTFKVYNRRPRPRPRKKTWRQTARFWWFHGGPPNSQKLPLDARCQSTARFGAMARIRQEHFRVFCVQDESRGPVSWLNYIILMAPVHDNGGLLRLGLGMQTLALCCLVSGST